MLCTTGTIKVILAVRQQNQMLLFKGKIKKSFSLGEHGHIKKIFLRGEAYKYSIVLQCVLLMFTQTSTFDYLYGILS